MSDQADQLRTLVDTVGPCAREAAQGPAMVVVASGRCGVGATTVAVNLAAVTAKRMGRVLLLDAVEERSNLLAAAGVRRSAEFCLEDVLGGTCEVLDAVVEGPPKIMVLARRRVSRKRDFEFRRNSSTCARQEQQRLMSGLDALRGEVDLIVVDMGSGVGAWSRRFWLRAQLVVLVTTADGPALMDSYSMLKRSVVDPSGPEVRLLVNRCSSDRDAAEAKQRFSSACERFLGRGAPSMPSLPVWDPSAGDLPRVWESPDTAYGHAMLWLGRAVANVVEEAQRKTNDSTNQSAGIQDAGCRGQGEVTLAVPAPRIPHPASFFEDTRVA
jgi:flagellar biosynthesis protein FlhG